MSEIRLNFRITLFSVLLSGILNFIFVYYTNISIGLFNFFVLQIVNIYQFNKLISVVPQLKKHFWHENIRN